MTYNVFGGMLNLVLSICLELFPRYSSVAFFVFSLAVSTVVPVWQCGHDFSTYVQTESNFFFVVAPALALSSFSKAPCWIFCPAVCENYVRVNVYTLQTLAFIVLQYSGSFAKLLY